jgi:hypothetical protein
MGCELYSAHHRYALHAFSIKANAGSLIDVSGAIHGVSEAGEDPPRLFGCEIEFGIVQGEFCRGDRKLGETASMLCPSDVHKRRRVEVADLAGNLAGVG